MFGVETVRKAAWGVVRWRLLRLFLLVLAVWAGMAFATVAQAQISSVRQAKLVTTDANGNPLLNDIAVATTPTATSSRSFDTTAFGSLVLGVTQVSGSCGPGFTDYPTWEIPRPYGWIRVKGAYNAGAGSLGIIVESAASQGGTFNTIAAALGQRGFPDVDATCVYDVSLLMVPFPGSVTAMGPLPWGANATRETLYPTVIGGLEDPGSASGTAVTTAKVDGFGYLYVATIAPPLATEDPIVPNSVTTSETVYTFDGTKRITLSNTGTGALLCTVTTNSSLTVTTSNYTFSLAAGSLADNGTGNTITLPYIPASGTYLRCVALSGTAIAVGFGHP